MKPNVEPKVGPLAASGASVSGVPTEGHRQGGKGMVSRALRRTRYLTRDSILAAIRFRERRKLPLDSSSMTQGACRDMRLWEAGRRVFGAWKNAVKAAEVTWRRVSHRIYADADAVISELRRRKAQGLSLVLGDVLREGKKGAYALGSTAIREFGGWHNAIRVAGLVPVPQAYQLRKYPDAATVIRGIRKWNEQGVALSRFAMVDEHRDPGLWRGAMREFGGWHKAIVAAGLQPVQAGYKQRKYPDAETVIRGIRDRKVRGLPLGASILLNDPAYRNWSLYRNAIRQFGDWRKAIEAAGLDLSLLRPTLRKGPDGESVISELRRWKAQGLSLLREDMIKAGQRGAYALYCGALREFGGWHKAIRAAGLEPAPNKHKLPKYPDAAAVIRRMREWNEQGVALTTSAVGTEHHDYALYSAAIRQFGGWHKAVRAAGIEPVPHGYKLLRYPDAASVIRGIRKWNEQGVALTTSAVGKEHHDYALCSAAIREFGGWRKAILVAGLEPVQEGYKRRKYPDAGAVIRELRRRKAHGLRLTSNAPRNAPKDYDRALFDNAVREFGSWKKALEAAHITLPSARRYPDADSVLRAIRERKAQGLPMTGKALVKGSADRNVSLYINAMREFGGWHKALLAAGLGRMVEVMGPKYPSVDGSDRGDDSKVSAFRSD